MAIPSTRRCWSRPAFADSRLAERIGTLLETADVIFAAVRETRGAHAADMLLAVAEGWAWRSLRATRATVSEIGTLVGARPLEPPLRMPDTRRRDAPAQRSAVLGERMSGRFAAGGLVTVCWPASRRYAEGQRHRQAPTRSMGLAACTGCARADPRCAPRATGSVHFRPALDALNRARSQLGLDPISSHSAQSAPTPTQRPAPRIRVRSASAQVGPRTEGQPLPRT